MITSSRLVLTSFRFVFVVLLSLVLLLTPALLVAVAVGFLRHGQWDHPDYLATGLICGLIAWLFVAAFHIRRETHHLPISRTDRFLDDAETVLLEMGYIVSARRPNAVAFQPHFHAYLFGGNVEVVVEGREATVTGPKVSLEMFRRRYRLQHHVHGVNQRRHEERMLQNSRRSQIDIQLTPQPEQLEAIQANVVAVMQEAGRVQCELTLQLRPSEVGKVNQALLQIREWLDAEGIAYDISRDSGGPIAEPAPRCATVAVTV